MGGAGTIGADQQSVAVGGGDLLDRRTEDLDELSSGVGAGVARPQDRGQQLGGVVTPRPQRMKPKGALECWRRVLFLAVGDHDHRVDVEHDTSPSSVSATLLVGSPSGSTDHTWRRARARAVWPISTCCVSHRAGPITGYRQASRPRSTLHLRSAFQFEDLERLQPQVSLAGQALPCIYPRSTPISRARSRLASTSVSDHNHFPGRGRGHQKNCHLGVFDPHGGDGVLRCTRRPRHRDLVRRIVLTFRDCGEQIVQIGDD
ncbi:MAG: hypothetical protein JWR48_5158 [Mycobacterium sp.]|jgi:hypothetical protein|nr:hypothetical protein [Mycobacterium sp.]